MMNCALYQILKLALKITLLILLGAIYFTVSVIQFIHLNELYRDRIDWKEELITIIFDGIFVIVFVISLIFHGHQTEATYRLDFIWKLQATGKFNFNFQILFIYFLCFIRGKRRHGTPASL